MYSGDEKLHDDEGHQLAAFQSQVYRSTLKPIKVQDRYLDT